MLELLKQNCGTCLASLWRMKAVIEFPAKIRSAGKKVLKLKRQTKLFNIAESAQFKRAESVIPIAMGFRPGVDEWPFSVA